MWRMVKRRGRGIRKGGLHSSNVVVGHWGGPLKRWHLSCDKDEMG